MLSMGSFEFVFEFDLIVNSMLCHECMSSESFRFHDFLHFEDVHGKFPSTLQNCGLTISKKFP